MMSSHDLAPVRTMLAGGDRRSIGRADEVAMRVSEGTMRLDALFAVMFDHDPVVSMRAADALEKVSAHHPERLHPLKDELLARLPDIDQTEVRWHVAQMLPRLNLTREERRTQAVPVLLDYLWAKSRIVQTFALQALADFASIDPKLQPMVRRLVDTASRTGSPAVKSRSRRLLAQFTST